MPSFPVRLGLGLLVTLAAPGLPAEEKPAPEGARHVETAGAYSFVPPSGWRMQLIAGSEYLVAVGPLTGDFAPSIVFTHEESGRNALADYVAAAAKALQGHFQNSRVIGQAKFATQSGLAGVRWILESDQKGRRLRQCYYFFQASGDRILRVTCSVPAAGGAEQDGLFDASLATLRWEKAGEGLPAGQPAALAGGRHVEAQGGFSYQPPADWVVREHPGMPFRVALGKAERGYIPALNFAAQKVTVPLKEFLELSATALEGRLRNGQAVSQAPFTTASGVKGYKLVLEGEQKERRLRLSYYFLDGPGNRRVLAAGTALAEGGEKLDAVFDGMMATFRWEAAAPEKKAGAP